MSAATVGVLGRPSPTGILATAATRTGQLHDRNEDAYALLAELDVYAVSDGIGGLPAGDTASALVVTALPELLGAATVRPTGGRGGPARTPEEHRLLLREVLTALSTLVRREAEERVGLAGMGATAVIAAAGPDAVTIAHLGDSRAYRLHGGTLTRLTRDHSVVELLLRRGEIGPGEARTHPARGRITRYVGMDPAADPDLTTVPFEPGDRLLLCTDGLTGEVDDQVIAALLIATAGDPRAACDRLVEVAFTTGGADDVTVVVADRVPGAAAGRATTTTARPAASEG